MPLRSASGFVKANQDADQNARLCHLPQLPFVRDSRTVPSFVLAAYLLTLTLPSSPVLPVRQRRQPKLPSILEVRHIHHGTNAPGDALAPCTLAARPMNLPGGENGHRLTSLVSTVRCHKDAFWSVLPSPANVRRRLYTRITDYHSIQEKLPWSNDN